MRTARASLVFIGVALTSLISVGGVPRAHAAPYIPDIDSLIDDSGPLPGSTGDLLETPGLVFTTPSGLACKFTGTMGRISSPGLTCAGEIPKAPAGTHGVSLRAMYDMGNGPARFLSSAPEDTAGQPVLLPRGHKIVFWAFDGPSSFVCGVPERAELVCVLRASTEFHPAPSSDPVTHGFVIAKSGSQVF
ncbi:hypothetical protein BKG80_19005 [Mycobacteroides chelonae]|uniref:hypothetical protein n=1 Tax=Mycobacteroides chelonae TaxID=1774 RepID=UPI0008AA113A|nr:hypothetical protein [Mycobacteroides chelonae]OHU34976.1 hypothetical protein BKG80_19005 [Mycobacteroides chelonae]